MPIRVWIEPVPGQGFRAIAGEPFSMVAGRIVRGQKEAGGDRGPRLHPLRVDRARGGPRARSVRQITKFVLLLAPLSATWSSFSKL